MKIKSFFGDKAFYRHALSIAVPIMLQNAVTGFVSLLDNIMVGELGIVPMSGVSIANTLLFVMQLAVFGAVSGAGIFGAQFFGKRDTDGVRYTLRYKLILCTAISLICAGIFLAFGEDLIMLYLHGEGNLEDIEGSLAFGKSYLYIMLLSYPAFAVSQSYASTLRETGQTVPPMVASIAAILINLCLNALLIFGKLGLPALGSDGAAIATVISRYAEAAIIICYAHIKKKENPYIYGLYRSMRIPAKLFKEISLKGAPLVLNEVFWAASIAAVTQAYSIRGYDVVSALNISNTLNNVCNVTYLAMGAAIGIIVGQLLGAGKLDEAKDTDKKLIVMSIIISLISSAIMLLLSPIFPLIYESPDSIRALAGSFMRVMAAIMPFSALANAIYFTLRTGGKTMITILFDSVYMCFVTVPVAFVLSRFTDMPIIPLYFCCQGLESVKCVLGLYILKSGKWLNNLVGGSEQKEVQA